MKLILRENVPNLGKIGEIVDVSNGYGRNYLLPRKLALLANDRNVKQLDHYRRVTAVRLERARVDAVGVAERLSELTLSVTKHAGAEGKLYGSVTNREIADMIGDHGFVIDKRDVKLSEPVRSLGEFEITIELHQGIEAVIKVVVEASELSKSALEAEKKQAEEEARLVAAEAAAAAAAAAAEAGDDAEAESAEAEGAEAVAETDSDQAEGDA